MTINYKAKYVVSNSQTVLKDKVVQTQTPEKELEPSTTKTTVQADSEDIIVALKQLGYQKEEIKRTFIKHATEISSETSIENQIKVMLKHL